MHTALARPGYRFRLACTALAVASTIALGAIAIDPPAAAQDGTSAATPTPPTNCIVPPVTVVTGPRDSHSPIVPQPQPTQGATPVASPGATPLASPMASPVTEHPRSSLEVDITATTRVLGHCLSEGKADVVSGLTGDLFRGQLLGSMEAVDSNTYVALASTLTPLPYAILSIEDIHGTGRTTAEATVTYSVAHQLRKGVWTYKLVTSGVESVWTVDAEAGEEANAPADTSSIAVGMTNNAYRLVPNQAEGRSVQLNATNNDQDAHEMLVLRLAPGVSTDTLLTSAGPGLPEGVDYIGQLTIPARSTGSLVLVDLEPGTYTIVCLLPDAEGVPHLAGGMETTFTIK
jgi:hypothetical protein